VTFNNTKQTNFLSILTEGEFFNKLKQVYKYRLLPYEESKDYGFTQKDERILEVDINYKDPIFGSL
jgi:hypothetical protein